MAWEEAAEKATTPPAENLVHDYKYWTDEMGKAKNRLKDAHKQSERVVRRYLDKREAGEDMTKRLNLYHSNIQTKQSMLFGQLPKVDVARRHLDPDDDVARVAAEIMERLLNNDVEEHGDTYRAVFLSALQDRLVPGLGVSRVRYEYEMETREIDPLVEGAEPQTEEILRWENAAVDYHYWRDVRWSFTRTWVDLRWVSFCNYLTQQEVMERFPGYEKKVTYKNQKPDQFSGGQEMDSEAKAEIWEIWDKTYRKVAWWSEGCEELLDEKEDPLKLRGFFPCPPFMVANLTTTELMFKSDFCLAQDLYNEIDRLETRIYHLTEACKAVGCYDASAKEVARVFKEAIENDMVPVENWHQFAETKGGMGNSVEFIDIEPFAKVIQVLVSQRDQAIALLHQVEGLSDIMRGAAGPARVSATEQDLKAKFGSIRIQALQDEFAQFVTDNMQLKAELICNFFSPQTILDKSGIMQTADGKPRPPMAEGMPPRPPLAVEAVQLLKNMPELIWRIKVEPESVAMMDYTSAQRDAKEFIESMGYFLQASAPLIEKEPASAPYLMKMLQWAMAKFKGASEIEGVLDDALEAMRKNPPQKEPDPRQQIAMEKMQAEQQKHQNDMQKMMAQHQIDMKEMLQKARADIAEEEKEHEDNLIEGAAQHGQRMAEIGAQKRAMT